MGDGAYARDEVFARKSGKTGEDGADAESLRFIYQKAGLMSKIQEGDIVYVFDKGYVKLVRVDGAEYDICRAARTSHRNQNQEQNEDRDKKLLNYLMRNEHTSPFEMCELLFEIKLPIFVARQMMRHRTANVNEMSGRYEEFEMDFYVPSMDSICMQASSNKQGRGERMSEMVASRIAELITSSSSESYENYKAMIDCGVAKEIARIVLPLNFYTTIWFKMDLNNLIKFLKSRLDSHAQVEIREYAGAMTKFLKREFPKTYELFLKHHLFGSKICAEEWITVCKLLNNVSVKRTDCYEMTEREVIAMCKRWNLEYTRQGFVNKKQNRYEIEDTFNEWCKQRASLL